VVSPACHREPVAELYVSHSKDLNYLTVLEALDVGSVFFIVGTSGLLMGPLSLSSSGTRGHM